MRPVLSQVKTHFKNCRILHVTNRGLNTSDNIYWLNGNHRSESNQSKGSVSYIKNLAFDKTHRRNH